MTISKTLLQSVTQLITDELNASNHELTAIQSHAEELIKELQTLESNAKDKSNALEKVLLSLNNILGDMLEEDMESSRIAGYTNSK